MTRNSGGRGGASVDAPAAGWSDELTPRQRDILPLIAEGLTDREIGARLFLATNTVKSHVKGLLRRLDARRRAQIVHHAHQRGWLE